MKKIPLTQGKYALVDDEDFNRVNQYKWYLLGNGYAKRIVNGKIIAMHRFILNASKGQQIDHINCKKLDNRKSNLRFCNNFQNLQNRSKNRKSISKYKGVTWYKNPKKWGSRITFYRKNLFIGLFNNEIEAALAYNDASKKYHGKFAYPNLIKLANKTESK